MEDGLVSACKWLAQGRDAGKTVETNSAQHVPEARRQPLFQYWVTQSSLQPNWVPLLSPFYT